MPPRPIQPLHRRKATREPKRRFTLFCEGKNTEPDYFRALETMFGGALIEIQIVPAAGVPATIADRAIDRANTRPKKSFDAHDEVWAVFDRDDHPNFSFAVNRCREKGVGVGQSNPCFELWLLLHKTAFDAPDDRRAVQSVLERHCPEYRASGDKRVDCAALLSGLDAAEQRSTRQVQRRHDEGNPLGRPSTTIHELTHAIRKAAEAFNPKRT